MSQTRSPPGARADRGAPPRSRSCRGRPMSSRTTCGPEARGQRPRASTPSCADADRRWPSDLQQPAPGSRPRRVVVHHQDRAGRRSPAPSARGRRPARRPRRRCRTAAGARRTRCRGPGPSLRACDRAAVHLDEPLDQRQADAQAALRALSERSTCANMSNTRGSISGGDADARCRAPRSRASSPSRSAEQPDAAAPGGVLGGVVQQVGHDLAQPREVGLAPAARAAAPARRQVWRPASISGRLVSTARRARRRRRRPAPGAAPSCPG